MGTKLPEIEKWVPAAIALTITVALFAYGASLMSTPIPKGNEPTVFGLGGGLLSLVNQIVGYYYGSSAGSARKDEIMKSATDKGVAVVVGDPQKPNP